MPRELGYFPYSLDGVIAPHTSGTLSSEPVGVNSDVENPQAIYTPGKNNGAIIKGNIGNTDYVFCNKIAYGVFAGDS